MILSLALRAHGSPVDSRSQERRAPPVRSADSMPPLAGHDPRTTTSRRSGIARESSNADEESAGKTPAQTKEISGKTFVSVKTRKTWATQTKIAKRSPHNAEWTLLLIRAMKDIRQEKHLLVSRLGVSLTQLNAQFDAKSSGQKNLPALCNVPTDLCECRTP